MIDKRFLFFRTKDAFERELSLNNVSRQSIVFIKDIEAIWTHDVYFYCKCNEGQWVLGDNLPIILSDGWDTQPPQYISVDRKLSLESENPVWNKTVTAALNTKVDKATMSSYYKKTEVDDAYAKLYNDIQNLYDKYDSDINALTDKFDKEILDVNDAADLLHQTVVENSTNISTANTNINTINNNIDTIDSDIETLRQEIEKLKGQTPSTPGLSDGIKHIILEEDEYAALTEYEDNAIYFVLEPIDNGDWVLGDNLPIYLKR